MKARVFLFSPFMATMIAAVFFCTGATFAQTPAPRASPDAVQTGTGTIRGQVTGSIGCGRGGRVHNCDGAGRNEPGGDDEP